MTTAFAPVPDWGADENGGAGVAVADLSGDGTDDLVVLRADATAGFVRVGLSGGAGPWSPWMPVPDWATTAAEGAGVAVADVSGTGTPDLVVFVIDASGAGANAGRYRVGWDLTADATVSGWSPWTLVPGWFPWVNQGGDVAVADVDGDGRLDLVVAMVDAPAGPNQGWYRSAPLAPDGATADWRPWAAVPDWARFWENQGLGVTVTDLDGDGVPELVVLAVDNPAGQNGGWYSVGWRLVGGRPADGWGPWQPVPDWRFWENQDAALASLGDGFVLLAVDDPVGPNSGWYRRLDAVTDRDTAASLGVWRLLENDAQVNPVHATLLHTGSVLFFAGSGNDPDRHAAGQYATAVWHYPREAYSRPAMPTDLFCSGHAFLPDGRLLAAGGTQQYDPFFGLRQAFVFDPAAGPPDPASPTGTAGAWVEVPDMAGGRWYPALLGLSDGHVLAVSGLDGTSQLNVTPEVYADATGWSTIAAPSARNWPQYAHLFLLADGRVFYSGGQYGGNNGVRPGVWDLATNTVVEAVGVLPDAGRRNQAASVLLPPAQAQRVLLAGGGPSDMHEATGATASTAVTDLSGPTPSLTPGAPMARARMHLCATLLPDRTVLVNGGSTMEESAADAALEAEIHHPDPAGGPGTWAPAATSRVPRLYHSVALLVPDGKVITSGSNPARKTEERRIEVFWPPYLFAGPRPTIASAATELRYGSTLTVACPTAGAVASASLLRAGATTHSSDSEQRLVDLPLQVAAPDSLTLTLPTEPTLAPPWPSACEYFPGQ